MKKKKTDYKENLSIENDNVVETDTIEKDSVISDDDMEIEMEIIDIDKKPKKKKKVDLFDMVRYAVMFIAL